jgi:UDP-N-acetylmuramate--alanine ligase
MLENQKDPSALLGSGFGLIGGNYRVGKGQYLIIEADEFDRSFLNFQIDYGALLNIEPDHLDYFKGGIKEIEEVFKEYLENNLKSEAFLVYNNEDKRIKKIISNLERKDLEMLSFGEGGDFELSGLKTELRIPGKHNRMNALAVFALSSKLLLDEEKTLEGLAKFKGAKRRFDYKGEKEGVKVYDDYAHHPTEVRATLQATRENFTRRRIIAVFQPHQYSRTKFFAKEFTKAFKNADIVIIPPIYEKKEIDNLELSKMIKSSGKTCFATKNFKQTVVKLKNIVKPGDLVMVMGAGPINEVAESFLNT